MDATEVSLNMHDFPWAEFRSTVSDVKIKMKYDINNSVPSYLFITNAREHENNTLKEMRLRQIKLFSIGARFMKLSWTVVILCYNIIIIFNFRGKNALFQTTDW